MKATKPEKHLLLPVRSSNIRNHIVNLPATLLLRGGFCYISPLFSYYKFAITCDYFVVRGFSSSACCFFVLHSLFFVFCLLLFIHRLSLFFCRFFYFMSAFYVCTFAGCSFCFVCFRFSFITNTLFCWKSKKVENFLLLQNKRNCLFGKEKDL